MVTWYERNEHGSQNAVNDLCAILNIDQNKLYMIARLARKWERKCKWQYCFPARQHEQKILEYLADVDRSFQNDINYIHWKINKKAIKNESLPLAKVSGIH